MTDVVGRNALAVREAIGWSRDRLAKASGVLLSAIYLLERLGWEGSPEDHQISRTLEAAAARRLEADTLLNSLSVAETAGDQLRFSQTAVVSDHRQREATCGAAGTMDLA